MIQWVAILYLILKVRELEGKSKNEQSSPTNTVR